MGVKTGELLFKWKNRILRLENQMVRAIPFGKLSKIWAVILGNAVFLPFSVCSANLESTLWRVVLPPL